MALKIIFFVFLGGPLTPPLYILKQIGGLICITVFLVEKDPVMGF